MTTSSPSDEVSPPPPSSVAGRIHPSLTHSVEQVASAFGTDAARGLPAAEAARRLDQYGPNDPAPISPPSWPATLARQFASKLILILVLATAISALLGEWLNAGAIGVTVLVSAGFGFLNEFRSEKAIAALRDLTARRAEVIRDGLHEEVLATQLVPGDVVVVDEGDLVPADARLVDVRGLRVNESILTGEPEAVAKALDDPDEDSATPATAIFAGTTAVAGSGHAIVVATGSQSVLGDIYRAMRSAGRRATPLEERLEELGNRLIIIFLALCAVVSVMGILQGRDARLMVELAVSLAIGAVPEGLPAVATTTLAVAVRRLAARNVLVRRLDAVETLGSTTVIATDKTGTLTENRMVVRQVILPAGAGYVLRWVDEPGKPAIDILDAAGRPASPEDAEAVRRVLLTGALCNDAIVEYDEKDGLHTHGDPSEGAIALAAAVLGFDTESLQRDYPRTETEPFTSAARFMRTVHRAPGGELTAVKGAFAQVSALAGATVEPLRDSVRRLSDEGFRVLATAEGRGGSPLAVTGAIVLEDPIRPDAAEAVLACHDAGIRVVLISGDQLHTARNIGQQAGILRDGLQAVTAADLGGVPLASVGVVARASHAQKEEIIDALQAAGEVVAMTGDGVNDAPALSSSDVGVAVGSGATDVAVAAAHIVLPDGRLFSLVHGIREGREIARNLREAIVYLLTASFATIAVIAGAMSASDNLPLAPLQILWLNLVVHVFPALALSTGREPMARATGPTRGIITNRVWLEIGWRALTVAAAGIAAILVNDAWSESDEHAQGMVFATLGVGLIGQSFLVGVHSFRAQLSRLRRPGLWFANAVSLTLLLSALYLPGFRDVIGLETLGADDWLVIGACVGAAWLAGQSLAMTAALRGDRKTL